MSWNGPCLQRNCFSKNFFQRNSFSRNCIHKIPHVREINLFDVSESAQPISPNIVPRHDYHSKKPFPRPVFYSLNIHIKTRSSFQETVSKACFSHVFNSYFHTVHIQDSHTKGTHLTVPRGSVRLFCRSVPSFRHSLTSPLFTFLQSKNCLHSNKQYYPKHGSVK